MPTLTLEGLPEDVYRVLEERAATNHRSLNNEVIVRLERSVAAEPVHASEKLARIDAFRERMQALNLPPLTDEFLRAAKDEGRP